MNLKRICLGAAASLLAAFALLPSASASAQKKSGQPQAACAPAECRRSDSCRRHGLSFCAEAEADGMSRAEADGMSRAEADGKGRVLSADGERPVTSVYSLEIGRHWARSTYLSPSRYSGTETALSGHWGKRMPFAPHMARMDFDARGALWWRMENPARNVAMQGFELEFSWQMAAFWRLPADFQVSVGGGPELAGGVLLLLRNSNNPVSVNLSAALAAGASLSKDFHIGRLPMTAQWRLRSPLIGAFFMPGYGETYYEIYLGNRKGLVHCGWPGNHFRLDSHLALQMDFGRTAMEVGYRFITDSMHANNLTTRQFTHAFTIGVIPHGLGRKKALNCRNRN